MPIKNLIISKVNSDILLIKTFAIAKFSLKDELVIFPVNFAYL